MKHEKVQHIMNKIRTSIDEAGICPLPEALDNIIGSVLLEED